MIRQNSAYRDRFGYENGAPLHGLILCGGRSKRLATDKALVVYRDRPHLLDLYDTVSELCIETRISVRREQADTEIRRDLPQIYDVYGDIGPIGGILSAFHHNPDVAWLVVGCDMPFLSLDVLMQLVRSRKPGTQATSFLSMRDGRPEPMCAIYEPSSRPVLEQFVQGGSFSPRDALLSCALHGVIPEQVHALANINRPEDMRTARTRLKS